VLIGEIGGAEEQEAARYLRDVGLKKPVSAVIVGRHAPSLRRMGHAGALADTAASDADGKIAALSEAGVMIAPSAYLVGATMRDAFVMRAA